MMENQRGQVSLLVAGLALVCMAVAGVAVDGTRAFLERRTLQNAADAAALAGAGAIDTATYYDSAGAELRLHPATARSTAARWLALRGIAARAEIAADTGAVTVSLRGEVPTTFLGLIGVRAIRVGARSAAEPIGGAP